MFGYACYTERFAGDLRGVGQRGSTTSRTLGVTYLHLMPLLQPREGDNDGGYAVQDYRTVRADLGTIDDLRDLATTLRGRGISLVLDLVLNHVAREHDVGRTGPRRGPGVPRLLPRPPRPQPARTRSRRRCPRSSPTSRPATSPGTTTSQAGCGRRSTSGSGTSTGPTPTCWWSSPTSSARWPTSGSRCCGWTRSRSSGSGSGTACQNQPEVHAITQVLRTVARIAAPALAFKAEAIVGPRDLVQYLGQGRHAGRVSDLAYHNSLMVQVWSMLATGDTVLARHALAALPPTPTTGTWITYVRCHDDIGWAIDDRDAAAVGLNGHDHRRFLADWYAGDFPGSWAAGWCSSTTPPPATSGSAARAASLAGLDEDDGRPGRRPRPAVPGARGRRRLGRGAGHVERRRARPAQRPRLGRRARARGRQPLGAPPPARLGPRRAARRPAHRPGPGVRRASPTSPGSAPALPQLHASAPSRVLLDTDAGVLAMVRGHASGPMVGPLQRDRARTRPFPHRTAARRRPGGAVRRAGRVRGHRRAPTAWSGCPAYAAWWVVDGRRIDTG